MTDSNYKITADLELNMEAANKQIEELRTKLGSLSPAEFNKVVEDTQNELGDIGGVGEGGARSPQMNQLESSIQTPSKLDELGKQMRSPGGYMPTNLGNMGKNVMLNELTDMLQMPSMGGMSKGGAAGVAGAAIAGIEKIVDILKGIWKMMVQSSGYLQAVMKLLDVGVMMIFRPMGDVIAKVLMPIIKKFALAQADIYKKNAMGKAEDNMASFLNDTIMNVVDMIISAIVALAPVIFKAMATLGLMLFTLLGEAICRALGLPAGTFSGMVSNMINMIAAVLGWLVNTGINLFLTMIDIFKNIATWWFNTGYNIFMDVVNMLKNIYDFFISSLKPAFDAIAKPLGDVGNAVGGIGDAIGGAFNSIFGGFFAEGGEVYKPTLAVVGEAGPERITPMNAPSQTGGATNIYITVNGNIDSLDKKITSAIDDYYRRTRWA